MNHKHPAPTIAHAPDSRFIPFAVFTAAVLLLLLAVLAHLAQREDYWLDEGFSVRRIEASWRQLYNPFALRIAQPAEPFDSRDVFDCNPPLYFALVRLFCGPHPGRLAVRLFSAVPLVLALLSMTLYARRACGLAGAAAVLLLGATMPAALYYGHEARPYTLPLAVACVLLWALPRLWPHPRRMLAACLAAAAAGALMHFAFAWWIIALFVIFAARFLAARREGDAATRRAALAAMAGLALGSLLAVLAILPARQIFAECKTSPSQTLSTEVMMNTFALPFSRIGSRPSPPALGFAMQFAFFLVFMGLLRNSPRRREGLIAVGLWLIPFALPVLMRAIFQAGFYERHAFFCLPGWLLAVGWTARECQMRNAECGIKKLSIPHSAFRIPHLILAALLLFNLSWSWRNLGRPIRALWRPSIEFMLAHARPGDAYTIDPDLMAATFALNARTQPAATWFSFSQGAPGQAQTLWIFCETNIIINPKYDSEPWKWRTEKVVESPGVSLYRAIRLSPRQASPEPPPVAQQARHHAHPHPIEL